MSARQSAAASHPGDAKTEGRIEWGSCGQRCMHGGESSRGWARLGGANSAQSVLSLPPPFLRASFAASGAAAARLPLRNAGTTEARDHTNAHPQPTHPSHFRSLPARRAPAPPTPRRAAPRSPPAPSRATATRSSTAPSASAPAARSAPTRPRRAPSPSTAARACGRAATSAA
jgi:translation initiation factor IF-2